MKFIKVENCNNCPFCCGTEDFYSGHHVLLCIVNDNKDIPSDIPLNENGEIVKSPEWCPLDKIDVCVSKTDFRERL